MSRTHFHGVQDNESNVFLIKPYHYFNSTREINNASGNVFWFEDDATLDDHLDNAKRVLTVGYVACIVVILAC
jgi:hypothetical protein